MVDVSFEEAITIHCKVERCDEKHDTGDTRHNLDKVSARREFLDPQFVLTVLCWSCLSDREKVMYKVAQKMHRKKPGEAQ